jgi:hypothetical protein
LLGCFFLPYRPKRAKIRNGQSFRFDRLAESCDSDNRVPDKVLLVAFLQEDFTPETCVEDPNQFEGSLF